MFFPLIRQLKEPLCSLVLLFLASGLFNTFLPVRLELEGFSPDEIGVITSFLYIGILIGSLCLSKFIERWGYTLSYIIFASITTLLILGQILWINGVYWAVLRLIGGICTAGIFIAIESWFLLKAPEELRGIALSLYLGALYGALSVGQFLINLSDLASIHPFFITAALSALSIVPIFFSRDTVPKIEPPATSLTLFELFKTTPHGFMGGVISGMLLAAVHGLVPLYGKKLGMEISEIGTLMAIIIFGGLFFQWPIARWSDKGNRKKVLNSSCFCTALLGLAIAFFEIPSSPFLMVLAWFFGGFAFTIYPLSMAYVCERVAKDQIVAATGGFVLAYGIGAIAGPILAPFAMNAFGNAGLFYFLTAITFLLGLFGLKRAPTN